MKSVQGGKKSFLGCSVLQQGSAGGAQQGFPPRAQLLLLGGGTQPFPCSDLGVGSFLPRGAGDPSYLMVKLL